MVFPRCLFGQKLVTCLLLSQTLPRETISTVCLKLSGFSAGAVAPALAAPGWERVAGHRGTQRSRVLCQTHNVLHQIYSIKKFERSHTCGGKSGNVAKEAGSGSSPEKKSQAIRERGVCSPGTKRLMGGK